MVATATRLRKLTVTRFCRSATNAIFARRFAGASLTFVIASAVIRKRCGFRKPQRFRITAKAMTKVSDAPANLRAKIAFVAERQNRVTVSLRNRVAVATMLHCAFAIGSNDARVRVRMIALEPAQQGRPKVETDRRVVINNSLATSFDFGPTLLS